MKKLSNQEKKIIRILRIYKNGVATGTIGEVLEPRTFQGRYLSMPLRSLFREGLVAFLHRGRWYSRDDRVSPPDDPEFMVYYKLTDDGEKACKELNIR